MTQIEQSLSELHDDTQRGHREMLDYHKKSFDLSKATFERVRQPTTSPSNALFDWFWQQRSGKMSPAKK